MAKPTTAVRVTVIAVGIVYTLALKVSGVSLDSLARQVIAALPAVAAGALVVWDLWLWRMPVLQRLTGRPRIDGLWLATLEPTGESHIPKGGNRGPIPAYLAITQSYWSLAIRQYTRESTSDSRASFWERRSGASWETVAFVYDNTPMHRHQHRSGRHLGTCQLDPTEQAPIEMAGAYFTDRYTKGDMSLTLLDRTRGYASFAAAEGHAATVRAQRSS
jgi:hypothetical protein